MNILCIGSICSQKRTLNRTLLFGSLLLEHGRHFDYWNQPLDLRYLDCHKAGLCCYLVIHIENILRPLQMFSFHSPPIYWLSLVEQARLSQIALQISFLVHYFDKSSVYTSIYVLHTILQFQCALHHMLYLNFRQACRICLFQSNHMPQLP
jgi:hypothetical protein